MTTKHVIALPYDKSWKLNFKKIKQGLLNTLGETMLGIEHVGSTFVEGLSSKPIIDIDIVIKDYSIFEIVKEKLALISYVHEGMSMGNVLFFSPTIIPLIVTVVIKRV